MYKIIISIFLMISSAYATLEIKTNVVDKRAISTQDAQDILDAGGILIDIRTPMEWEATGVIDKSMLITFYNQNAKSQLWGFIKELSNNNIKKNTPIVLICNSGFRTKKALEELNAQGFSDIKFVDGGILQWKKDKLPLIPYQE